MAKKAQVVETETETEQVQNQFEDSSSEAETTEESLVLTTAWDDCKPTLESLEVTELKEVIDYCQTLIDEIQREEVEALEAEMRAIQNKLLALQGRKATRASMRQSPKRTATPIINPADPSQTYTFGRMPDWLSALMVETGKTLAQLRDNS